MLYIKYKCLVIRLFFCLHIKNPNTRTLAIIIIIIIFSILTIENLQQNHYNL